MKSFNNNVKVSRERIEKEVEVSLLQPSLRPSAPADSKTSQIRDAKQYSESRPNKAVTFAHEPDMRSSLHINEFDPEEKRAAYYSKADFRKNIQEVKQIIKLLENNKSFDDNKYCTRGVHWHMKNATKARDRAAAKVLQGQKDHSYLNEFFGFDTTAEEKIAMAYSDVSGRSTISAHATALSDQKVNGDGSELLASYDVPVEVVPLDSRQECRVLFSYDSAKSNNGPLASFKMSNFNYDDDEHVQESDEVDIEESVSHEVQVEVVSLSTSESCDSESDGKQCRILFSFNKGKVNNVSMSSLNDDNENHCPNYNARTAGHDDHFCLSAMPK